MAANILLVDSNDGWSTAVTSVLSEHCVKRATSLAQAVVLLRAEWFDVCITAWWSAAFQEQFQEAVIKRDCNLPIIICLADSTIQSHVGAAVRKNYLCGPCEPSMLRELIDAYLMADRVAALNAMIAEQAAVDEELRARVDRALQRTYSQNECMVDVRRSYFGRRRIRLSRRLVGLVRTSSESGRPYFARTA